MIEKLEAIIKGILSRNVWFKLKAMIKNVLPLCPSPFFPQSTIAAAPATSFFSLKDCHAMFDPSQKST